MTRLFARIRRIFRPYTAAQAVRDVLALSDDDLATLRSMTR